MKKLLSLILSLVLALSVSMPVKANNFNQRGISLSEETLSAAYMFVEVLELILNNYHGDPVTTELLLEAALRGMTDELDRYSVFMNADDFQSFTGGLTGRLRGIGVSMMLDNNRRPVVTRVFQDSPAQSVGVRSGDIILYIDGINVYGKSLSEISALITTPDTDYVLIKFERDDITVTFNIRKAEIRSPTVIVDRLEILPEAASFYNMNLDNFRYMQVSTFARATGGDVRRALNDMRRDGVTGIILDLRSNSGGYLDVTMDIANMLVPQGVVLQTVNNEGRRRTYTSSLRRFPFESMVVLVNRFTASAAEVIASALQDANVAIVAGEPTFGKGLVQSIYALTAGGALMLTTEEYFRRSGGQINEIGVIPCVAVERDPENQTDCVLLRGIELLIEGE